MRKNKSKLKILTVVGARPQFIKASVVSRQIAAAPGIKEVIVHTGQHFDHNMSRTFFRQMRIPFPDYFLGVGGLSHAAMTGRMLEKLEKVMLKENPDWVIVYGDTNSTLAGALAAKKVHIRIAHVEAGLRSFNMKMPEEINRVLTDRLSDILFCPTKTAVDNLKNEGFLSMPCRIVRCGDVMYDAALYYACMAKKPRNINLKKRFVLATVHRAENTASKQRLHEIIEALSEISRELDVILPLHPGTRNMIKAQGLDIESKGITVIEPVGYLQMIWLLKNCVMVMTDSGGLQKEAFFFKKPCLTLRDETEWTELIEAGVNMLTGARKTGILKCFNIMKDRKIRKTPSIYGNGSSASKIIRQMTDF